MKERLLGQLTILLYSIALLHIGALYFFWYWRYPWIDNILHFLGGFWIAGMIYWILLYTPTGVRIAPFYPKQIIVVLLGTVLIGFIWEMFEFSLDTLIILQSNNIADTTIDIIMDIIGGASALVYGMLSTKK